ncbi:MAG TPA: DUF4861 domain-containing protein [Prevotella sp.]|nr:DUF4861 domain-containing protein [Prevotella sp.]
MKHAIAFFVSLFVSLCARGQEIHLSVSSDVAQEQAPVTLNLLAHPSARSATVLVNGKEVPCQLDDLDDDGRYDELAFLTDIDKGEKQQVVIHLSPEERQTPYPARTYAEMVLRNPKVKEKNKHDIYLSAITLDATTKNPFLVLHHHGVAFENELVAMRIYMDERQTVDLYGKYHKGLELHDTQFYTSKTQKEQGYGDDILWVGNTFGLGALRGWNGMSPTMVSPVKRRSQRIVCMGPVRTIVEVADKGWQRTPDTDPIDMIQRYTLYAGHRDVEVEVTFGQDLSSSLFSTGIVNVKGSEEYSDKEGLRGCWGTDWPATDTLNWKRETVGLGIFIPKKYRDREWPANNDNYLLTIRPDGRQLRYHLTYTSANEDFGFHSAKTWFAFLKDWKKRLTHPVKVQVIP